MKEPTLVILAAGLGSRYGGLKQIDAVGSHGESIIDFSIYDAIQAGFKHVVMIIRPEHATLFDEHIGNKIRPFIDLRYAFQDVHDLPAPYVCPDERTKPWGTTHAMLCCRDLVDGPFMICNADDFYGPEAFKQMYRFLTEEVSDDTFCMIGYPLQKTLTENGTVTRGLCQVENGLLTRIIETKNISKADDYAYTLNEDGTVNKITDGIASMNFWGFTPKIFELCSGLFDEFLAENINELKAEALLPTDVGRLIREGKVNVRVLKTNSEWFGVTYSQDKPFVTEKIAQYRADGIYPEYLWEEN